MTILDEVLVQLELLDKESKIYLANLELGTALASEIANKAEVNRGTSYDILNSLIRKGLVHYYWKKRTKLGIPTRGIAPKTTELVKFCKERNKKELRKVCLIPSEKYHFINEIDIYADKVAIMNLNPKNYMGVIIKNKDIAETQKAIFELAWAGAKALYKEEY